MFNETVKKPLCMFRECVSGDTPPFSHVGSWLVRRFDALIFRAIHVKFLVGCFFTTSTLELSGRQRQDSRPGLAKTYRVPQTGPWWPAVGAPLERGVRRPSHHHFDGEPLVNDSISPQPGKILSAEQVFPSAQSRTSDVTQR